MLNKTKKEIMKKEIIIKQVRGRTDGTKLVNLPKFCSLEIGDHVKITKIQEDSS